MSNECLLLNADASPATFIPLSTVDWQEAIRYMVLDKVTVVEWHEDWIIRSNHWETKVPAIIMLKEYHKKKNSIRYSKLNVFLRDEYECQYCGIEVSKRTATLDHVLPVSHGGKSTWENSTTSCGRCNSTKGNNKKIKPHNVPYKPSYWELLDKRKKMPFEVRHSSWIQFLN